MSITIVALPQENDPVYQTSSEKVPHLTILALGDSENTSTIIAFVEHAAKMALTRFSLDVDHRGTLGPDNADVLFFQDNWELPKVKQFRDLLLKEPSIKTAYDSVKQFQVLQDWTPHLTLGYPATPAKRLDHPIFWVQFDRIAVWTSDFAGPEFLLDKYSPDYAMDVAMMTDKTAKGQQFLAHHGILGMKWGHRKAETTAVTTKSATNLRGKAKVKASGGEGHPPHPDAIAAAMHKQKLVKSGMAALSNKDLQDLQTRMQLESNVGRLHSETSGRGKKFVKKMAGDFAKQAGQAAVNEAVSQGAKKVKKVK